MNEDYRGKILFLQAPGPAGYGSGEYVIVEQSPNMLFGAKTSGGYDAHALKPIPLYGDGAWTIVRVSDDPKYVRRFVRGLREFAARVDDPEREWLESVYRGAEHVADQIERLLDECETGCDQSDEDGRCDFTFAWRGKGKVLRLDKNTEWVTLKLSDFC